VRELENCVERACVVAGGPLIGRGDLLLRSGAAAPGRGDRRLKPALNAFKANFIREVLDENGWNQTEAARALGIQRTYLSRLIKELGMAR
jgi:Nif-specific regulatory protein